MALLPIKLPRLPVGTPIVDDGKSATTTFAVWWNSVCGQIESSVNGVIAAQNAADAAAAAADAAQGTANGAATDAATAQTTANGATTAASAAQTAADNAQATADNAVVKNQTAAPAYSAYGGQTISNPPTQAQVQALDDAVHALSSVVVTVINKLHAVDVFS